MEVGAFSGAAGRLVAGRYVLSLPDLYCVEGTRYASLWEGWWGEVYDGGAGDPPGW